MFCVKCGANIKDTDAFCYKCGAKIVVSNSEDESESSTKEAAKETDDIKSHDGEQKERGESNRDEVNPIEYSSLTDIKEERGILG